jgi:hypothetical protein
MSKCILYTRPDGGLSVVIPYASRSIAEVIARDVPKDATGVTMHDVSEIPSDRSFRDAWQQHPTQVVSVDMSKARAIHLTRLRAARNAKLNAMDAANTSVLKRVAAGSATDSERQTVAELELQKQILRDSPAGLDLSRATTVDELKAIWPVELPVV